MGYCIRCDRKWESKTQCHCSGCCQHFRSVFAFDKHRFGEGDTRRCLDSEEMLSRKMVYDEEKKFWTSGKNIRRFAE